MGDATHARMKGLSGCPAPSPTSIILLCVVTTSGPQQFKWELGLAGPEVFLRLVLPPPPLTVTLGKEQQLLLRG